MLKAIGLYIVAFLVCDYGCYFQAAIFLGLEKRFPGSETAMQKIPYRPADHPVLLIIGLVGLIDSVFAQISSGYDSIIALIFAAWAFALFCSRYIILKRRLQLR